jgi:hypothetical protein
VTKQRIIGNLLLFQVCWFGTAFGVSRSMSWLGPTIVLLSLACHLTVILPSWREGLFILAGGSAGYLFDTLMAGSGVLLFSGGSTPTWVPPAWLWFQWLAFLMIFHVSLHWVRNKPWLAAGLSGVGGPLTYLSAAQLGVLQIGEPLTRSFIILAIGWSVITPALFWLGKRPLFNSRYRRWHESHAS